MDVCYSDEFGICLSVIQMSLVFVCLLCRSHLRSKIKLMSNVDWTKLWYQSTQKSDRFKLHLFFVLLSDQASFFVRLPISIIYSFNVGRIKIVIFCCYFLSVGGTISPFMIDISILYRMKYLAIRFFDACRNLIRCLKYV